MKLPYLAILTAFTILVSCTHDPLFPSDPEPPVSATCHPDTVYFQNEILPLFTANCASAGCHGATNPADAAEGTIRKIYATSLAENAIHGSDSDDNAKIEANFHFSSEERF